MKKIPCLFIREFRDRAAFTITDTVTPGCEWALAGEGVATRKWDGTACLVRDGKLFCRYNAKRGRTPPPDFEPCGEPDETTGHHPGWVPVGDQPEYKWHRAAWERRTVAVDGTHELCGPHFQGNPEKFEVDGFVAHGTIVVDCPREFAAIRSFLEASTIEGVVFHHPDGRMCKIRRDDFGFSWPVKS